MGREQEVAGVRVSRKLAEDLLDAHEYTLDELACRLETSQEFLEQEVWLCRLKAIHEGSGRIRVKRPDALSWPSSIELEHQDQRVKLPLAVPVHSSLGTSRPV